MCVKTARHHDFLVTYIRKISLRDGHTAIWLNVYNNKTRTERFLKCLKIRSDESKMKCEEVLKK